MQVLEARKLVAGLLPGMDARNTRPFSGMTESSQ